MSTNAWTAGRLDRLAFDFLSWDARRAEGERIPEPLRLELRDFARWLMAQHEQGPDSATAFRALRCFGLRQDA